MATHSSILAWRIPWTEEAGRLQSMGSKRVRHDLVTKQQQPKQHAQNKKHLSKRKYIIYIHEKLINNARPVLSTAENSIWKNKSF